MKHDLVIKGGTLVTASEMFIADIGINGEKIVTLGESLDGYDEINADKKFVMPGGIEAGIVFQSFHLIPTMTALENVATPLELAGVKDAMERARAELAEVGLAERGGHFPAQLSGGEQQRVALARAAVLRPNILLADEPTGNLDGQNGSVIMDMLFSLREKHGSTLVLVTHDPVLAKRCDRMIALSDGRIVSQSEAAA